VGSGKFGYAGWWGVPDGSSAWYVMVVIQQRLAS